MTKTPTTITTPHVAAAMKRLDDCELTAVTGGDKAKTRSSGASKTIEVLEFSFGVSNATTIP